MGNKLIRPCSESLVKSFHNVVDMHKAQKRDVELVKAGGHTAKDLRALDEVFNQMARLVAVPV